MITSLGLGNFKSFRDNVDVALRPINLVYGENSAGKSSLVQAMLLLKQSWRANRSATDEELLEFRGAFIDLGGYGATVTDHDYVNNELRIAFSIDRARRTPNRMMPFATGESSYQFIFGTVDGSRKPHIKEVMLRLSSEFAARFEYTTKGGTSGLFLADAESARTVVNMWLGSEESIHFSPNAPSGRRRRDQREVSPEDISWAQGWLRKTPCTLLGLLPVWSPHELREGRPGRPVGGSLDSPKRLLLQEFVFSWQFWMSNLFNIVAGEFAAVKYVGPLRRAPQRLIVETSEASRELGPRGEQALRVLAAEPALLTRLNASLERLEIPYILEIAELASESDTVDIGDISVLSLLDRRNGTKVTLGDVGVGVSQVLPVLMQLLLLRNSPILIEQPELHLHPRLQSRLADVLVESATRYGNTLLIETHSEHLLVRLQRRIRGRELRAKDLQVLYVGNENGDSKIQRITLGSKGEMIGGWPGGFFDERLEDLLGDE